MKNSNSSQKSCKFYHTIQQFLLEMGEINKETTKYWRGEEALATRKENNVTGVKQVMVSKERICNSCFKAPKMTSR